jgi:hypothetical protein
MKVQSALTPVVLALLAGGASAYAYLVDRGTVSDADRSARRTDLFPSLRIDDVRRVDLTHGTENVVLERDPSDATKWVLTSPRREIADSGMVDALLRELDLAKRIREVPDADAAGLDAPRMRGSVSVGRLRYEFALGADAPRPEGSAYLRIEGEGTFVVGRTLKVQLLRTAETYRDRTLVTYGPSEVARIRVEGATGSYTLERSESGFRVGAKDGLRASRAAVDRVFAALADARVETFVDDSAGTVAAADARLTVTLWPRNADRPLLRLLVGGPCPSRASDVIVSRTEPTTLSGCVAKNVLDGLTSVAETLVDDRLVAAHGDEVEELRLESLGDGGCRVDLARRGSGWHERAPEERDLTPAESESADSLLGDLARARAVDVRSPGPGEHLPIRARATLVRTASGTAEVIELAASGPDGITVGRRNDDGAVVRLPREVARRFEPHPIALRARDLWAKTIDPADVVAIDDSCGPEPERLELRDGRWTMRAPAGFSADARAAADLADAFARARADAWITESDDGTFGLRHPTPCSVVLTLSSAGDAGTAAHVGLIFGGGHDGGDYARTLDGDAVLLAPASLRLLASHPAIDRTRFRLDPADLTSLTLARGGARHVLDGAQGHLTRAREDVDAGSDEKLEKAIGAFYAQDAVHPGAPLPGEGFDQPTLEIEASTHGGGGPATDRRITVGALTRIGPFEEYFARVSGVNATFAVPKQSVDGILAAW